MASFPSPAVDHNCNVTSPSTHIPNLSRRSLGKNQKLNSTHSSAGRSNEKSRQNGAKKGPSLTRLRPVFRTNQQPLSRPRQRIPAPPSPAVPFNQFLFQPSSAKRITSGCRTDSPAESGPLLKDATDGTAVILQGVDFPFQPPRSRSTTFAFPRVPMPRGKARSTQPPEDGRGSPA
jgi:hypothetical protein